MIIKVKLISLTGLILLLCAFVISAQRVEISKEEYSSLTKKIGENTMKRSYRIIHEDTTYSSKSSQVQMISKGFSEYLPSGDFYRFSQSFDPSQQKPHIFETYSIAGVRYEKGKDGKWRTNNSMIIIGGKNIGPEIILSKYYLTKDFDLEGKKVDLFEFEETYVDRQKMSGNEEISETKIRTKQRWTIKDNLWHTFEMENAKGDLFKVVLRGHRRYEYDPNIKIEVPVINQGKKP